MRVEAPRSILITGASSGIGAALARAYAAPGVSLHLGGRDRDRLHACAQAYAARGAVVAAETVDVADPDAVRRWVEDRWRSRPLDLVIANAGISAGTGGAGEDDAQTRRIFATNLDGVVNTVLPALGPMRARGRGQIAIMSSLAGLRGFPGAPAYSASKAAVRVWGEALRGDLAREGIAVSVICPSFVATPMTARNRFAMPMIMPEDRAAAIIRRGLARNRARIAFPLPVYALTQVLAFLPAFLIDPLLGRLPRKD